MLMTPRIRQIALVARELEPAVAALREVLGIEVSVRDPGVGVFGLENAVLPVGDTFLEVVSPTGEGTSAGRLLERRGGDGGYMVIVQVEGESLEPHRSRVAALGVRIAWEVTLDDIATVHLHPRDVGGAIVSLDVAHPPSSWRWAGSAWEDKVRTHRALRIAGAEIQADDPAHMARRWADVLAAPEPVATADSVELAVGQSTVRFVPVRDGRGEGLSGVDVAMADRAAALESARRLGLPVEGDQVTICGTRFRLEEQRT
jgi:hypothetical protein